MKIIKGIIMIAFILISFCSGYLFGTQDTDCAIIQVRQDNLQEQECFIAGEREAQKQFIEEINKLSVNINKEE